jgi:hypothetical protein
MMTLNPPDVMGSKGQWPLVGFRGKAPDRRRPVNRDNGIVCNTH